MRTEVRRGRKFVEYTDDNLPKGTFVQDVSGADVSYQDEAGKWNPLDEGWETDGKDGFSFRASRMNHKVRFDSAGAWRWYPRRNVDTEYIVTNRPECWLPATNRWGNLLVNDISRDGRDITLASVRNVTRVIHSRWNGIKTDWILQNANAPTKFRQKIDLVGITEKEGVLYGKDGAELARLTPTTAIDANGKELPCAGSYIDGYLEFSVDASGAAYPVTVDPDFAGDTADGYIQGLSSSYSTARSTASILDNTNTYLRCGQYYYSPDFYVFRSFLKFDTSGLPDNATITQVNLKLVCIANDSGVDFDVQIVKQDWSSQDPLSSSNREAAYDNCLSGTADSSIWRNTSGISLNTQYASGNLATDWINKTGATYYSLRSSRDKSATAPTGAEHIQVGSAEHATSSYRPVLTVAYTTSVAYTLACAAGSYALTGSAATFEVKRNYTLTCNAGSYALTGTAVGFVLQRNFTVSLTAGSYAQTGTPANLIIQRNYTLACNAGNYALTGAACIFTVLRNYTLAVNPGSYALTGVAASFVLQRHYSISLIAGNYAITGTNAALTRGYTLSLTTGSYATTGVNAVLTHGYTLSLNAGGYALTGSNITLEVRRNYTFTLDSGSYALTGTDAAFEIGRNYVLPLGAGSYALTGTPVTLLETGKIVCEAGSYALTGTPITFAVTRAYALTCDAGSYVLTGTNATFSVGLSYSLICNAGAYALTGTPVNLAIQRNYTLALNSGSYVLTGPDIAFILQRNYLLSLAAGSYALTGTNAAITFARTLALGTGSYALTGTNAGLFKGLVLPCTSGSYALNGTDITANLSYIFALGVGDYVLLGTPCGLFALITTPTPACRTYAIPYEDRTYAIPYEDRTLEVKMLNNQYLKDPSAELDWAYNWNDSSAGKTPWLAAGETITSFVITADTGIAVDKSTESDGKVTVWLSGGTAGQNYKVACLITSSAGRTDERTIWIKVTDR